MMSRLSLVGVAALSRQEIPLWYRLNALGNYSKSQTTRQHNHHLGNRSVVGIRQYVPDKTLVDLELIQRQALEVRKRRVNCW